MATARVIRMPGRMLEIEITDGLKLIDLLNKLDEFDNKGIVGYCVRIDCKEVHPSKIKDFPITEDIDIMVARPIRGEGPSCYRYLISGTPKAEQNETTKHYCPTIEYLDEGCKDCAMQARKAMLRSLAYTIREIHLL